MTTVSDLIPGQIVSAHDIEAMVVNTSSHPIWPHLALVVWKMHDGTFSFDALDWRQDVGDASPTTKEGCTARWRAQMTGSAQAQGLTT